MDLWNQFVQSGKIEDYINYKKQEQNSIANNNQGTNNQGTNDRRE